MPKVWRTDTLMSGIPVGVTGSSACSTVGILSGLSRVDADRLSEIPAAGSSEVAGFQCRVGLVDDLQLFLRFLVAAMGVGMVHFYQHLVTCLEACLGEGRVDVEHRERLLASRSDTRRSISAGRTGTALPPGLPGIFLINP